MPLPSGEERNLCLKPEFKPEGRSLTESAFDAVARAVKLKILTDDRKTETATADAPLMVAAGTVIPLPDILQLLLGKLDGKSLLDLQLAILVFSDHSGLGDLRLRALHPCASLCPDHSEQQ